MSLINQQAEEAVIASLLVDPSLVAATAGSLSPDEFGDRNLSIAFTKMVDLSRAHRHYDAIVLAAEGVQLPDLDILAASRGGGIEAHIQLIRDAAFRRGVHHNAVRVAHQAESGASSVDILASLQKFSSTVINAGDTDLVSSDRAAELYLAELDRRKTQGVGLSYGFPKLDRFLQPARGGDMVVIAARPSVGKTAFAEAIADNWAESNGDSSQYPVLFVSIEMSLTQLMDRAVSRTAGIPAEHIVRGTMSADEEHLAAETIERRKSVRIWYYDDGYATTESVRSTAARCAMLNGGIRGIVVDYIQILKDKGDAEVQRVTKISRNIKALAREYNCPVLALSQLNRQSEYRDDPHPRLSDIRESGAIEQDADVVLGLYRNRAMEDGLDSSDLEVDILKNRQGPSQMRVVIPFHGTTVSFDRKG